jgi:hypothetical protein
MPRTFVAASVRATQPLVSRALRDGQSNAPGGSMAIIGAAASLQVIADVLEVLVHKMVRNS